MSSENKVLPDFVKRYCESLKEKSAMLQLFLAEQDKLKTEREDLLQSLHKLVGSGGMYGFEDLSSSAQSLHKRIAVSNDSEVDLEDIISQLSELIAIINNIIIENT